MSKTCVINYCDHCPHFGYCLHKSEIVPFTIPYACPLDDVPIVIEKYIPIKGVNHGENC